MTRKGYDRAYYLANHDRIRAYQRAYYATHNVQRENVRRQTRMAGARRHFLIRLFKSGGCVDCGEQDPVVLEFDHVYGEKRNEVSQMGVRAASVNDLVKEVNKCEVRCANCHCRATAARRALN